ncbi:MAG: hypothetical protein JNM80_08875 [Phycisphaerae bacterium]|nr:hypothetical protein [Phycisphaerae bacterium]
MTAPNMQFRYGAGLGSWENPNNWVTPGTNVALNRVPGEDDAVYIPGSVGVVHISGAKTVKSLELGNAVGQSRPVLVPPTAVRGVDITTKGPMIVGTGFRISGRDGWNDNPNGGSVVLTSLGTSPAPAGVTQGITIRGSVLGGNALSGNPLLNQQGGNGARAEVVAWNGTVTISGTVRGGDAGASMGAAANTAGEANVASHRGNVVISGTVAGGVGARGTNPGLGAKAVVLAFEGDITNTGTVEGGRGGVWLAPIPNPGIPNGSGNSGGDVTIKTITSGNVLGLGRLTAGTGGAGAGGSGVAGSVAVICEDHPGTISRGEVPAGAGAMISGLGVTISTGRGGSIGLRDLRIGHIVAGADGVVIDTHCESGEIDLRRAAGAGVVLRSTCCVTMGGYVRLNAGTALAAMAAPVINGDPRCGVSPFDINGDGEVTKADIIAMGVALLPGSTAFYDVNCDGVMNALDLLAVINAVPRNGN